MTTLNLFIYTETSLHAGTGSTVSVVDLPIQRERTTQFPVVQGSGLKGALRSQVNGNDSVEIVFGPETTNAQAYGGAISVGDAQILLFPVQSLNGVFAYVTCRGALARLKRVVTDLPMPEALGEDGAHITNPSAVRVGGQVVLEEFSFIVEEDAVTTQLAEWFATHAFPQDATYDYWRNKVRNSLVVLRDTDFRDFVVNSTEITTHVRIDPLKKTVQTGALWTREALPSDCLFFSSVQVRDSRNPDAYIAAQQIAEWLKDSAKLPHRIQLGGDETTGNGFVALRWN
ncbi:type III-B CRISPR module RAMP protein Cmr4 [Aggregatilineales bacterium SYSU G02658]